MKRIRISAKPNSREQALREKLLDQQLLLLQERIQAAIDQQLARISEQLTAAGESQRAQLTEPSQRGKMQRFCLDSCLPEHVDGTRRTKVSLNILASVTC